MGRTGVTRTWLVVATVVAGLGLTACGGGPSSTAPPASGVDTARVSAAFDKLTSYGFESVTSTTDSAGKAYLGEVRQVGMVQNSPLASKVDTTLTQDGQTIGASTSAIFVGGKGYVQDGAAWVALADSDPDFKLRVAQREQSLLLTMFSAVTNVHSTGQQSIDGTATTGFAGTFNVDQFSTLAKDHPDIVGMQQLYVTGDMKTIDMEVWVDSSLLARRVVLRFKVPGTNSGPELTTTCTVTFSKFNQPVDVKAPI